MEDRALGGVGDASRLGSLDFGGTAGLYANNDSVRADLHCLMTTGTGAMQRPLLEFVDPSWRFRPRDVLAGLDADDCGRLVDGRQGAPPARTPAPVPAEQAAEGDGGPGLLIPGVVIAIFVLLAVAWWVRRYAG